MHGDGLQVHRLDGHSAVSSSSTYNRPWARVFQHPACLSLSCVCVYVCVCGNCGLTLSHFTFSGDTLYMYFNFLIWPAGWHQ